MCVSLPIFFTSLLIRVSSAMIMYDRRTLLDTGQRYTNLIQNTLSADPAWPLEILRNNVLNNDHLNNRREAMETPRETCWNTQQTEEKGLTALLYQVFCSLMSNPWRIRWTILEPGLVSNETLETATSFV